MKPADVLAWKRLCLRTWREPAEGTDVHACLAAADLFMVSADMTAVALAAAAALDANTVPATAVPAPCGFILYEGPAGQITDGGGSYPITGFLWAGRHGQVHDFTGPCPVHDDDDSDEECADARHWEPAVSWDIWPLLAARGLLVPAMPIEALDNPMCFTPGRLAGWDWEALSNDFLHGWSQGLGETLLATWLLMGQTLARTEDVPPDRASRRAQARAGLPAQQVKVVLLRRRDRGIKNELGGTVDWTHRWYVDGYWQPNHYNPATGEKSPAWISGHVKGPDDKPLVVKAKVTALVR